MVTVNKDNIAKDWRINLEIANKTVSVKLDTGAQCNVMSKPLYDTLTKKPLKKSKVKLISYSGHSMSTIGKAELALCYKSKYYTLEYHIVNAQVTPVLGLQTCLDMNLVQRIYTVNAEITESRNVLAEYDDVFEGLGTLEGKHHIQIDPTVKPVVHPPRKIPFKIKDKLKAGLDQMEEQGVIEKVVRPTDWVNSIVVVEKPQTNKIRICLDSRDLNKGIKREHYPMKTVEEVAAKLTDSKIYTVLDAGNGFW